MKKKLLTGLLAMVTCFSCFTAVACDNGGNGGDTGSNSGSSAVEFDLEAAKDALEAKYLTSNHFEDRVDYDLVNSITFDGQLYDVSWSVDVEKDVTLSQKDGQTHVTVNKNASEAIPYVLTATISKNGQSVTLTFNCSVAVAPQLTPEAITAAPVEGQAYKFYVYQQTNGQDCYFSGLMSGFYFQTVENYEEGVDVYVEYKENSTTEFYLYFEHTTDGKQYIGAKEGWNSTKSYWTYNVVFESEPVSSFVYDNTLGTIITTIAARSNTNDYNATQDTTVTLYFGNYSSYVTMQASKLDKASSSNVAHLVEMVDKNNIAPEKKVATVKGNLSVQEEHKMNKEIALATADENFPDVSISWALSATDKGATITADNKLALTIPATEQTVTLTATITCGEATDTKDFTLKLGPAIVLGDNPTASEIVNAAYQLAAGEQLASEYTLSGVINKVNTAFDSNYNNVTVTITVADKDIQCFRLKGEGADTIKVGDTIEVKGTLKNHNGTVEFDAGCALLSVTAGTDTPDTPDTPVESGIVKAPVVGTAYTFGMVQANNNNTIYYLAGGMSSYYLATTDDASKALSVYLETAEGGYYLYCNVDNVKTYINCVVSDTHVNGKYETTASTVYTINADGLLTATIDGAQYAFGTRNDKTYTTVGPVKVDYNGFHCYFYNVGATQTPDEKPDEKPDDNAPAADSVLTIADALAYGVTFDSGAYSTDKYYLVGEIVELKSTMYGNMVISDGTNTILIYGTYSADGSTRYDALETKPVVGDTVKVYGIIGQFNGTAQMKNGWIVEHTPGEPVETPANQSKLDLTTKDNRTTYTTEQQVWEQNGVKLTNNKDDSTSNVGDYEPCRLYKSSTVIIECTGMTKIVFNCASASGKDYAGSLKASIDAMNLEDITVTVDGLTLTLEFAAATDSFTVVLSDGQVRLNSIEVVLASDGAETPVVEAPVAGQAYVLEAVNKNGCFYLDGTATRGRLNGTTDKSAAASFYFEAAETEGEWYIYCMVGDKKTYLSSQADNNSLTFSDAKPAAAHTWIVDTAKKTITGKTTQRVIASQDGTTYTDVSAYGAQFIGTEVENKGFYVATWFNKI